MKQTDVSQDPDTPQFPLGPTTSEAKMNQQLVRSPLGGPGEIVNRLGQQFQFPRASPDAQMSERPGINTGES